MSTNSLPGESRTCPHCKSTILKSAVACPACHHFLRFEAVRGGKQAPPVSQPLLVEGTIRPPALQDRCEYSLVAAVYDARGEEISRHVISVGAIGAAETRTFKIWVEIYGVERLAHERSAP